MARPKSSRFREAAKEDKQTSEFMVPEDPEKLVAWLKKKRDAGKARMPETQMKLNLAYFLGQQWVVWDADHKRFRRATDRSDDPNAPVRVTVNKIGEIGEHFIARLLKSAPEAEVRPITDDDDDVGAAKASTRILLHEQRRLEWENLLVQLYFWVLPLGWAFLSPVWDPKAGPLVGTVKGEGPGSVDLHQGEITCEVVPAFELAVDPNAKSMEAARWCVRSVSMTKEAVWEVYGVVPVGDSERSLVDDVFSLIDASYEPKGEDVAIVQVHQLWMKPGRASKKGLVVTWSGDTVLEPPKPFPYKHGQLPFVEWDLLPPLGNREGRTWVTDLVPLQADYNDARSREAVIRRTLVPKVVYPAGSINPRMLTSRVEQIPYNPVGEAPQVIVPDSGWMAQYETSMNRADMEMGSRAGQSDVSSGKPSSASMPAAAILALQEADDTKMAVTAKLLANSLRKTAWQLLQLVRQYWAEERLVRTWSEAGTLEVAQFRGADVAEQLDVHVESDSALPRSRSARVQLAMELLAMGPPGTEASPFSDWRDVIRMLDLPGTDFLVESLNVDAKQADRENDDLLQGVDREVHPWDNHMVHIAGHEKVRKGEEYEKLSKAAAAGDQEATQAKAAVDAHLELHYQLVLPQLGVPTPPGTSHLPGDEMTGPQAAAGGEPGQPPMYTDPATGMPPNGVEVGAGHQPSALSSSVSQRAGIGGPGQPGRVPGTSPDQQAASMGA